MTTEEIKERALTVTLNYHAGITEKATELHLLDALQTQLPDGYLRDIIRDAAGVIRQAIRNDYGTADIRGLHGQVIEARKELVDVQREIKDAQKQLQEKQNEIKYAQRHLDRMKNEAHKAADDLRSAVKELANF